MFTHSLGGLFVASLLVTSTLAAPTGERSVVELVKRITCSSSSVPINNTCVPCNTLFVNATVCSRQAPTRCSYGVPINRACTAATCTGASYVSGDGRSCIRCGVNATSCDANGATSCSYGNVGRTGLCEPSNCSRSASYLSADGKSCVPCQDPYALTCTSTEATSCGFDYTLSNGTCIVGTKYARYAGYGFAQPFAAPSMGPTQPDPATSSTCARIFSGAPKIYFSGTGASDPECTAGTTPLEQSLISMIDPTTRVLLKGVCNDYVRNNFVRMNSAQHYCTDVIISASGACYSSDSVPGCRIPCAEA